VFASVETFLTSTGVVAISEIGDKTQLLALLLASRFKKPVPIILGILVATTLNHAAAGLAGAWLVRVLDPGVLRVALGVLFLAMAGWALIPDTVSESEAGRMAARGAFVATAVAFFLAEMGDKTQIATAALAARFDAVVPVVLGTTLGMMIADVPAVLVGEACVGRRAGKWVRYATAALFLLLAGLAASGIELGLF
jgi:putative Ca2+/H+ antiporter (TMEM165/GDT1 family)